MDAKFYADNVPVKRRVLSTGPTHAGADTIVIDVKNRCFWRGEETHSVPPTMFRVLTILILRMPDIVWLDEMIDLVWGHREDGGPLDPMKCLHVHLCRAKDVLRWLGLQAVTEWGKGRGVRPLNAGDFAEPAVVDMSMIAPSIVGEAQLQPVGVAT